MTLHMKLITQLKYVQEIIYKTYLLVKLLTVGSLIIQLLGRLQPLQPTRFTVHDRDFVFH